MKTISLPVLVGDTIIDRFGDKWQVTEIDIFKVSKSPYNIVCRLGHEGTDDYCAVYTSELKLQDDGFYHEVSLENQ